MNTRSCTWFLVVPFLGIDCCTLSFHSWQSFCVSCYHVSFPPPPLACAFYQCVYHMLTECTTRTRHQSEPVKPFSLSHMRSHFSSSSFTSSSLDHTQWPHDIEDLSDHGQVLSCKCWMFSLVNCHGGWCSTRKSSTYGHKTFLEVWRDVRTDSSSLNVLQAVWSWVLSSANGTHVTQVVEESYHLQLIRLDLNSTLQSAVNCFSAP